MPVSDEDRIVELSTFAESAGYNYLHVAALKGWLRSKNMGKVSHQTVKQWQTWMNEALNEPVTT